MAGLRHFSNKIFTNFLKTELRLKPDYCVVCVRYSNYSPIIYDEKHDPSPKFFNKDVQYLLKNLTRVDIARVNRRRKLGDKRLEDPEYKFMTDEELRKARDEAVKKTEELLQIPPVVPVRKPIDHVFSRDPALEGLEESKLVFTDITFGIKDSDRLIVVRETDGTLREAEWELKNRMNQIYFPNKWRMLKPPKMFYGEYLDSLLNRKEYEFILDRACMQFEPNDSDYQRVVSVTYQHINDNNAFDLLRSTRHFGALTFFLAWNKMVDNLLLELLQTCYIDEAKMLIELYSKLHDVQLEKSGDLGLIEEYISKFSNKKAALELGLQAYKDVANERKELDDGIKAAHGLS